MLRWYIIQTYTGQEEKLVRMVRRVVPREFYDDCFVIYHEQLWRRHQENQIHIRRVFPGYVFITSGDPEGLFLCLKNVPAMSKLLADGIPADNGLTFLPMYPDEAAFLSSLLDEDHIIRLSYVATDGKDHATYISGPLELCVSGHPKIDSPEHLNKYCFGPSKEVLSSPLEAALSEQLTPDSRNAVSPLVSYRFRKRYAVIRVLLSGEEKEIRLGIILNDDIHRELSYGKVETPLEISGRYHLPKMVPESDNENTDNNLGGPADFASGDVVIVSDGAIVGLQAIVCKVDREKQQATIKVKLFGRDLEMKVRSSSLKKI